jgi:hypothetical protein
VQISASCFAAWWFSDLAGPWSRGIRDDALFCPAFGDLPQLTRISRKPVPPVNNAGNFFTPGP